MLLVFDIPPSLSAQSLSFFLTHTNMHVCARTNTHTHRMVLTLIEDGKMLLLVNVVQSGASNFGRCGCRVWCFRDTVGAEDWQPKTTAACVCSCPFTPYMQLED